MLNCFWGVYLKSKFWNNWEQGSGQLISFALWPESSFCSALDLKTTGDRESTNIHVKVKDPNSWKVKVLHIEQISTKTSHSAQLQLYHQTMQSSSSISLSETPMEWLARRKAAFGGLQGRLQGHHLVPGSTPKVNYRWQNNIENIWSCCCSGLNWHFPLLTGSRQRRGLG